MGAFSKTLAFALFAGLWTFAFAQERPEADIVAWIAKSCPDKPDPARYFSLDQVAGKALNDFLRNGRYREAEALAVAYYDCLKSSGLSEAFGLAALRFQMLGQSLCFLPLIVFEIDQSVNVEIAERDLARCPKPPLSPEVGEGEDRTEALATWGEHVRRYLHLVGATKEPEEVLEVATQYLEALRKAGFEIPGERQEQKEAQTKSEEPSVQSEEEKSEEPPVEVQGDRFDKPDPGFAAMLITVAAAVAKGDVDRLVEVLGGEEKACSSLFMVAVGVVQAFQFPRRAALPLVETSLIGRSPLDRRVETVKKIEARFSSRPCALKGAVADLVLSSLTESDVEMLLKEARLDDVARLVMASTFGSRVPAKAESKIEIFRRAVALASENEKGQWLCALGETALEAKRPEEALQAFREASNLAEVPQCVQKGEFKALALLEGEAEETVEKAAKRFLDTSPDASDIYMLIKETEAPKARLRMIEALRVAGLKEGTPKTLDKNVAEAFIKVVDTEPGSEVAEAAAKAIEEAGRPGDEAERVVLGFVLGRHKVMAGREKEALSIFKEAFAVAKKEMEGVASACASLLRWLASREGDSLLGQVVQMALKARLLGPDVLATVAALRGERGDRKTARALLAQAVKMKPSEADEWVAIAEAYARIDEPAKASAALERVGPEEEWDARLFMIKGRIETARKRYREAAAAYTKAANANRGDCEPLYFRALVRLLMGDGEGAEQDFEQCKDLGVKTAEVFGGLAYAQFDQSRYEDAEANFRKALEIDDKTPDNYIGLALTLFRLGRLEEAAMAYNRAVELEPAMGKGYSEAEKKGFIYSAIEKKVWSEMVRTLRRYGKVRNQ